MLIDLHAHSSGISKCCRISIADVLDAAEGVGLDGIVLTNHYQKSYITDGDVMNFAEKYIEEFHLACRCAEGRKIRVFFGIEVTMELYPNVHMLVYGVDEDFLREHSILFDYSLEELYAAVKAHNGTLIQAHPFRNGTHVMDTAFLDGVEINCHPIYKRSYAEELTEIAEREGLALTCGGDYHADTYRPHCGTYIPDSISSSIELGAYLGAAKRIRLRIHEPNTPDAYELEYDR